MSLKRNTIQWEDALARVEPTAFVELVGDYYLREGYRVERADAEARQQGHEGGVDLRLHRGDEHIVVQCKHWRACQVPHNDVHELLGIMGKEGATAAIIIATGEFTAGALRAARNETMRLVDGRTIRALLDPIAVLQAARASDARASANPPLLVRPQREARQRASRPYLVPAMVFAGCLIVATGILRSLPGTAHPSLPASGIDTAQGLPQVGQAVDDARSVRAPDAFRPIDHEAARAALRPLAGVRNAAWLDASNLVVTVDGAAQHTPAMIDTVCRALEPLGDTLSVVVNLRDFGAEHADATATLSRNCQLPRRLFMQASREIDMLTPGLRDTIAREPSGPH